MSLVPSAFLKDVCFMDNHFGTVLQNSNVLMQNYCWSHECHLTVLKYDLGRPKIIWSWYYIPWISHEYLSHGQVVPKCCPNWPWAQEQPLVRQGFSWKAHSDSLRTLKAQRPSASRLGLADVFCGKHGNSMVRTTG